MYKFPSIRDTNSRRAEASASADGTDFRVRIIPQREGGLPMPDTHMATLRDELAGQEWLDGLMSMMKAAGNDTRVRILYLLWRRGEVRVNDLAQILELTTPAISQQLKKLRNAGLVRARRDAQTIYYRLNADSVFIQCVVGFFEEEHD